MSDSKSRTEYREELTNSLREARASTFEGKEGVEDIEEAYEEVQRTLAYYRAISAVLQARAATILQEKTTSREDLSLNQGRSLMAVRRVLEKVGATDSEVHTFLFGEAKEGSPIVKFGQAVMHLVEVHDSLDTLASDQLRGDLEEAIQDQILTTSMESTTSDKSKLN